MLTNPELRRNIWLDFSLHRMILTLTIVGLIVYLYYLFGGNSSAASTSFALACFFIFLWGTKSASETVIEEVNNNTWDFQRQTAISPWSMAWGKLLGSTLFSWYGATLCLALWIINVVQLNLKELVVLILGGLFSQATALLLSLQLLPQIRREHNNRTYRYFLIAAMLGIFVTTFCFEALKAVGAQISWHHYEFSYSAFTTVSLIIFLGWAILGLQRSFSKELQYQNIPWVWAAFNLFCMIYFSGFVNFDKIPNTNITSTLSVPALEVIQEIFKQASYYIAFFVAQLLTYIALLTEELTTVRYKYIITRQKEGNIQEALQQFPWWPISFIFTLLAGVIAIIHSPKLNNLEQVSPSIFILTTTLFLLRDILLVHFFSFGKNAKKAISSAVLYLFLLYLILPMILGLLHLNSWQPMLLPSWGQNTPLALFALVLQIGFFASLCWKAWATQSKLGE